MGFQIVGARESDWSLIVERSKETAWRDLSPQRREGLEKGSVSQRLSRLIREIRGDRGRPHQAFVARDEAGQFAGYIWLTENTNYFTGQKQALILDIYVEEKERRKGLGRRFLSLRDPVRRTG
ncbi:MAG: GNAT family N-acetyltransferase [Anaerolineae bacterium]